MKKVYTCPMHRRVDEKNDQHFWNFFFSVVFAGLLAFSIRYLLTEGLLPTTISLFDTVLIIFAVFRVTRFFVYDRIAQFVRDMFVHSRAIEEGGVTLVERVSYTRGPFRTIHEMLDCPWCTGVWVSLMVVFAYLAFPYAWYVIFFLAVAGAGSLLQLVGNLIGWKAENLKLEALERGSAQKDR